MMARIERVELAMVDLAPKVERRDAIQSFVSQETPLVTVTDMRRSASAKKVFSHALISTSSGANACNRC